MDGIDPWDGPMDRESQEQRQITNGLSDSGDGVWIKSQRRPSNRIEPLNGDQRECQPPSLG